MPLYEYECDACGHRFEKIQKFSDPLEDKCPKCGGHVHKLISSPAIQFKGSGFYITDYPKGDKVAASILKAGYAQARMNRPEEAKQSFRLVVQRFPKSDEARLARERLAAKP